MHSQPRASAGELSTEGPSHEQRDHYHHRRQPGRRPGPAVHHGGASHTHGSDRIHAPVPGHRHGEWKDGDTLFLTCVAWRLLAENIAESLEKGMRVIATGRIRQRSYVTRDGEKRTAYELHVDDAGPSLSRATARVARVNRPGNGQAAAAAEASRTGGEDAPPF
jgi:hypothetical protein